MTFFKNNLDQYYYFKIILLNKAIVKEEGGLKGKIKGEQTNSKQLIVSKEKRSCSMHIKDTEAILVVTSSL